MKRLFPCFGGLLLLVWVAHEAPDSSVSGQVNVGGATLAAGPSTHS